MAMGVVHVDFTGFYRGSIGNCIYYIKDGENFVRKKPGPNENKNASPLQIRQQKRFAIINLLARVVREPITLGFVHRKPQHSPANLFVHFNTGAWKDAEEEVVVDYTKLILAKGDLIPPAVRVAMDVTQRRLTFVWEETEEEVLASADDRFYGVIIDARNGICRCQLLGMRGETRSVELTFSEIWDLMQLQVYVFAVRKDGRDVSDSQYTEVKQ